MRKEDIINIDPDRLTSQACKIFKSDPEFKKEYEKKWDAEIECPG